VLEAEFDRFADEYRAQHAASVRLSGETPDFFAQYKIDDVARALRRLGKRPRRILDFGGGVGNALPFLRRAFPGSDIVLLDPSALSLEIAQARFPGEARFRHFDGASVPFEDGRFDLVFAACVFHHIPADLHAGLLGEIGRVLEPGGSFFLFEHNPLNPLTRHAVRACAFDENAALIGAGTMRERFAAAGFSKTRVAYRLFFPRPLAAFRPLERYLVNVPLGAQYFVHAVKPAV
jgi:SAM-dependent methyltransferase